MTQAVQVSNFFKGRVRDEQQHSQHQRYNKCIAFGGYSLGGTAQELFHTTLFPGFSLNILKCICLFCIKYLIFQRYLYNNKQHSFPLSVVCHLTPDQYKVDCLSVMRNRVSEMENVLQRSKVYAEQTVHSDLFTLRKFLLVWF